MHVLTRIVSGNVRKLFEKASTVETMLEMLVKAQHPKSKAEEYLRKLIYIRQIEFPRIADYYEKIKKTVRKWSICKNVKVEETDKRVEEYFLINLDANVEIEMKKLKNYE